MMTAPPWTNNLKSSTKNSSNSSDQDRKSAKIKKHTSPKTRPMSSTNVSSSLDSLAEWTTISSGRASGCWDEKSPFCLEFFTYLTKMKMALWLLTIICFILIQSWTGAKYKKRGSAGCYWLMEKVSWSLRILLMFFNKFLSFGMP